MAYSSIERNQYFTIKLYNSQKVLAIADSFKGESMYDYSTLKLVNPGTDYLSDRVITVDKKESSTNFKEYRQQSTLVYDGKGFHKGY